MLRNVLILSSTGGTVLFEKAWVNLIEEAKLRMVGGLITTIQEFARQSTQMGVSYLEFTTIAVSMVLDTKAQLICTLFHDIEDGAEFGRLIAHQILMGFLEEFRDQVEDCKNVMDPSAFHTFNTKISDAISCSSGTVLNKLKKHRGIKGALFLGDDGSEHIVGSIDDPIGTVANLSELLDASSDMMQMRDDVANVLTLHLQKHVVFIHRFNQCSLISICRNNVDQRSYVGAIEDSVILLSKVYELVYKLQGA